VRLSGITRSITDSAGVSSLMTLHSNVLVWLTRKWALHIPPNPPCACLGQSATRHFCGPVVATITAEGEPIVLTRLAEAAHMEHSYAIRTSSVSLTESLRLDNPSAPFNLAETALVLEVGRLSRKDGGFHIGSAPGGRRFGSWNCFGGRLSGDVSTTCRWGGCTHEGVRKQCR
jgi:hypothetical protein